MQEAFWPRHGLQCGSCTPGMIVSAVDMLQRNPEPTPDVEPGLDATLRFEPHPHEVLAPPRTRAVGCSRRERSGLRTSPPRRVAVNRRFRHGVPVGDGRRVRGAGGESGGGPGPERRAR
jgi:hypothetical protein